MTTTDSNRDKIFALLNKDEYTLKDFIRLVCCSGYGEPGYTDPEAGIIVTANWNDDEEDLFKQLEDLGVACEWSDEWEECSSYDCHKLLRTQPDSYHWKRSYWFDDANGGITCHECLKKDPSDYIEYLKGNDSSALTFRIDLAEHGYVKLEERFERGLYGGQSADPRIIGKSLQKQNIYNYIFELDSVGQFDARFSVWIDKEEFEEFQGLERLETDSDEDPAHVMERSLNEASEQLDKLKGEGIKVAHIDGDKVSVELVSHEDFVKGKS